MAGLRLMIAVCGMLLLVACGSTPAPAAPVRASVVPEPAAPVRASVAPAPSMPNAAAVEPTPDPNRVQLMVFDEPE